MRSTLTSIRYWTSVLVFVVVMGLGVSLAGCVALSVALPWLHDSLVSENIFFMILPLDSDLLPVVDYDYWQEISADPAMQSDERIRCTQEPWYWLVNYAYTLRKDENVEGGSVERFPPDEYLRYICHKWFTEKKLAVDKSRQMRMTWLFAACPLWMSQYRKNEEWVCQSKKEQIADKEIIRRAKFIWEKQPSWLKPQMKYSFCKMSFPTMNSTMIGIPKGGDQIRSFNPTGVFIDEGGFFEGEFEDCRTAALACCEQIKVVCTANAGQWDDFINDNMRN